jgi:hypothetical protein
VLSHCHYCSCCCSQCTTTISVLTLLLVLLVHYIQMGARIKAGASIDIGHLQQLSSRRRWSFTIAAAGTASLALGALMGTWGIQNLKAAIANRSAAEPGILQLAYRRCIKQQNSICSTLPHFYGVCMQRDSFSPHKALAPRSLTMKCVRGTAWQQRGCCAHRAVTI